MQVTYTEAFLRIGTMQARNEKSFVAWLSQIAQNNLRDAIRALECGKRPNPKHRALLPDARSSVCDLLELGAAQSNLLRTATPDRFAAKSAAAVGRALRRILQPSSQIES